MSGGTEIGKPDHDFVFGESAVSGIGFVGVEKHIDSNVGLKVVCCEGRFDGRGGDGVAYAIGPVKIEVHLGHLVQLNGEDIVHHDIREGMHRLGRRAGIELPSHGEAWCSLFGRVGFIVVSRDLW